MWRVARDLLVVSRVGWMVGGGGDGGRDGEGVVIPIAVLLSIVVLVV